MHHSEESKTTRFVSGLRKEIQDILELYEYSSLEKLVHLAIKVESQVLKKMSFKKMLIMMASINLYGSIKTYILLKLFLPISQKKPLPTIEFLKKSLPPLPLGHPPKP